LIILHGFMAADSAVWDAGGPTPQSSKFECGNRVAAIGVCVDIRYFGGFCGITQFSSVAWEGVTLCRQKLKPKRTMWV
jgi:hypothetical protein